MERLKETVPTLQDKTTTKVSSLDIIQHAIFYIHDLWSALDVDEEVLQQPSTTNSCAARHNLSTEVF
uniref:Uncharacterized protein LOC100178752 n=1 Tax=Phallusia mammillata TaxID=59560 RepID=A0A6F9DHF0_9ASCI|nr:uncharacterized protein LOC100178752 [Phallusia mammillata]